MLWTAGIQPGSRDRYRIAIIGGPEVAGADPADVLARAEALGIPAAELTKARGLWRVLDDILGLPAAEKGWWE